MGEGAIIDDWEDILDKGSEEGESSTFISIIKKEAQIYRMAIQYRIVDVMLNLILPYDANQDCILFLKNKGFRIDDSNKDGYIRSIEAANRRKESWKSRIESLKIDLEKEKEREGVGKVSFYDILAELHEHGFHCDEDIKLILYLSYKKRIKEKIDAHNRRYTRGQRKGESELR